MHKLYATDLHSTHACEEGSLLVVLLVPWAASNVLFKVQTEERFAAVWTFLLLGQRLLFVLELLQKSLALLAVLDMCLEQRDVQDPHTDRTFLEELLVIPGLWQLLLTHYAVRAGDVVIHGTVRTAQKHLLVSEAVCANLALLRVWWVFV